MMDTGDEAALAARYAALRGRNARIDMTRGKPSAEQLDLADPMLSVVGPGETSGADGTDYRNYGLIAGIPEARALFASLMGTVPAQVVVGGNSSLTMMYDALAGAVLFGVPGGAGPWRDEAATVLCPVPGYDRHFAICERLGLRMVPVDLGDDGPDLDAVERAVAADPTVKAMWCVPKFSNPTGIVYSDETVRRLAAMETAAPDFRLIWDNAYAFHHLGGGPAPLADILAACAAAGHPDRPLVFVSTSKVTHAGAGVAAMAASPANVADALRRAFFSTIGPDKINQLRHVRFFGDAAGLAAHMNRQATILAPKFRALDRALTARLGGTGLATWTTPGGGYFVSLDVTDGCAAEVVRLAGEAGLSLVPAGSTFPYGKDPRDRNIRLAPTMLSVEEIEAAMEILCTCVALVAARKGDAPAALSA